MFPNELKNYFFSQWFGLGRLHCIASEVHEFLYILSDIFVLSSSELTDISVVCGTSAIDLAIQICPAVYTGYNETLLILNHIWDNVDCQGTLDTSVVPPVLRFSFPIREGNDCGSNFMVRVAWMHCLDSR